MTWTAHIGAAPWGHSGHSSCAALVWPDSDRTSNDIYAMMLSSRRPGKAARGSNSPRQVVIYIKVIECVRLQLW